MTGLKNRAWEAGSRLVQVFVRRSGYQMDPEAQRLVLVCLRCGARLDTPQAWARHSCVVKS